MDVNSLSHSKWNCKYHIVFAPKFRRKVAYGALRQDIYNLERMLIELVRFRGKLPFDYYKEIIGAYRNRVETMDIAKVEEYAARFKHSDNMMQIIELEVL